MILVTGSSGFVGSALVKRLSDNFFSIKAASRNPNPNNDSAYVHCVKNGEINGDTDWSNILNEVEVVIHVAGHAHSSGARNANALNVYRNINTFGTLNLARQAQEKGVKRFIYISSIKVNGESTANAKPFYETDIPAPRDYYGLTKYEAEQGLLELASKTNMEVVIIRPPLVYGPGVRANFLALFQLVCLGIPLPFGSIKNKRSLLYIENLTDLIQVCISHREAKNRIFLASDSQDISTSELLVKMGIALNRPAYLFYAEPIVRAMAFLFRKSHAVDKLFGSLEVNVDFTREVLGWLPPVSLDDGLRLTAEYFLAKRS